MDRLIVKYCNTCNKSAEFYCNGCNSIFCQDHADQHQQSLYEQLDWLTVDHDDFAHTLHSNDVIVQRNQSSKKIIDRWEEESIRQIQKTANEARCALIDAIKTHLKDVKEKLKLLTKKLQEVNQNHTNNNKSTFDERNIKQWAAELHNLKHDFHTKPTFTVRIHGNKPVVMPIIKIQPDPINGNQSDEQTEDTFGLVPLKNSTNTQEENSSLISRYVNSDVDLLLQKDDHFHLSSTHVKILDRGQVVVHDLTKNDVSISGLHEYSQGEHKLFFHIEHMTQDEWMFFGIISKQTALSDKAYTDPSAHGWAGYDRVYINGKSMSTLNGYHSEMKLHDIIELTIDCNKKALFLWHSGQKYINKLPIDVRACPFPWQFLISFHNPNDSIRILPSSVGLMIKREQEKLNKNMAIKEAVFKNEHDSFLVGPRLNTLETV